MPLTIADAVTVLEEAVPLSAAAEWDAVGFQVGDPTAPAERLAVCHEVTPEVMAAAATAEIDLLVAYHPLLFSPTRQFTAGGSASGRAFALAAAGIGLHVVHTAFDVAPQGCAAALADAIGLLEVTGLGAISPMDEPAGNRFVGRIGHLEAPVALETFAGAVADVLGSPVRIAGDTGLSVYRVAAVPGSGSDFTAAAATAGADVIVTGDVSHHRGNDALSRGIAVIDAGHAATERPGVARLYSLVSRLFDEVIDLTGMDPSPWESG